jgi:hypothetical protein
VSTNELLDALWRDYVATTPQAERIHKLLGDRGEVVRNDHIALRTYGLPGIGIDALARPFEAAGWVVAPDHYRFDDKKLVARYWKHPDPTLPKVFISELRVYELSASSSQIIEGLVSQLPKDFGLRLDLPYAGRPWTVRRAEYDSLLHESEYAAWVAAFGFRVNHFTVNVNGLTTFPDLLALNAFLVDHGFTLNESGGAIKGTPDCWSNRRRGQTRSRSRSRTRRCEFRLATTSSRAATRSPTARCSTASCPPRPTRSSSRPTSNGERREVVVQFEQDVDVDTDELDAHARGVGVAGPADDRGEGEHAIRRRQRELDRQRRADLLDLARRDVRAAHADVAGLRRDPCWVKRRPEANRQHASGARFAPKELPSLVPNPVHSLGDHIVILRAAKGFTRDRVQL